MSTPRTAAPSRHRASCKHNSIRVFEEVTYNGTIDEDGQVHYNSNAVVSVDRLTAECMDCDQQFDDPQNDEEDTTPERPGEQDIYLNLLRAMHDLIFIAAQQPQPATHDGLQLADAIAAARAALAANQAD